MTTFTATAEAAGSFTFTTSINPVSTPDVTWYTDAARTLGSVALTVTGTGHTFTASWAGAAAPAAEQVRYLKVEIETSTGATTDDADDDILFVGAAATLAVNTSYTTLAAVKADLGITDNDRDVSLLASIRSASREIDRHTGTTFYPINEARVFDANSGGWVGVDRFTSTVGLAVNVGSGGTYGATVDADAYILHPHNAPNRGLAYERIYIPVQPSCYGDGWPGVQVTASWGWHYVPDDVEEAARLRAIHLFHRREAPHGNAGYGDDPVVSRFALAGDSDVTRLLAPYTDPGIA